MTNMTTNEIIENIRQVAAKVLPKGSALYLYGSRARGDYNKDSDWELLLLLDKSSNSSS
ncbi:MAG: nucleotidyltransferase domain-containing protein, partial [Prevotella sp.]|nr:nucleotidyltransferase domain-containing protein [Prevotella sp.]